MCFLKFKIRLEYKVSAHSIDGFFIFEKRKPSLYDFFSIILRQPLFIILEK